jgi:UrcA family protein
MRHRVSLRPCGAVAASLLMTAPVVFSAPPPAAVPPSVAVNIGDLDLTRVEEVARLYARIHKAARQVCNPQGLTLYLPQMHSYHECYRLTVDDATARAEHLIREHRRDDKGLDAVGRERGSPSNPL